MEKLKSFAHIVDHYVQDRDILDRDGTSDLSMFLKNGSITITQIINHFGLINTKPTPGKVAFLRQLIWREFYFHILWHWPHSETESFNPKYRDLPWENNQEMFSAWTSGKTGYPVVDAAMRQLAATGRMHNRARMIVASFLTKDLLIDWRWGERWFMNQLLDGDLAANNGGWQWAASTGCDPQPYFRIFNPTRQSERFDPDGDYIRRWVPELRDLAAKEIHWPSDSLRKSTRYPAPIVDHGKQSIKAQMLFKK
jgi:deoxyribodipyrimidine photo-lyase